MLIFVHTNVRVKLKVSLIYQLGKECKIKSIKKKLLSASKLAYAYFENIINGVCEPGISMMNVYHAFLP